MAKIVVLEDDASTRLLIVGVLKKSGHEVIALDNGAEGLLVIMAEQPDLVISDVQMPKMTGFEVVAQMRQTPEISDTPVILLTSLSARSDIRTGMSQGADDYITKPFEPAELVESVNAQLQRVQQRQSAIDQRAQSLAQSKITQLKQMYEHQLSQAAKPGVQPVNPADTPELASRHLDKAWVMHVTVHNQAQITSKLPVRDWRLILRTLYSPSGDASALKTASFIELLGSDLLLVFADQTQQSVAASVRAARAVADMVDASVRCKRWAASHFVQADLPPLRVAISLHAGPVDMATIPLDSGGQREVALGATMDQTLALRSTNPNLVWLVAASEGALADAADLFRTGASERVSTAGKDVRVHALLGLGAAAGVPMQPHAEPINWM